jgi:hypothetical protein
MVLEDVLVEGLVTSPHTRAPHTLSHLAANAHSTENDHCSVVNGLYGSLWKLV